MSVARAQQEIDSREFSEWAAFLQMEHDPDDIRAARQCLIAAKVAGNKGAKIEHFLPKLWAPPQTGAEMKAAFRAYSKSVNAVMQRQRKQKARAEKKRQQKPQRTKRGKRGD
jgi:hypothetical protein